MLGVKRFRSDDVVGITPSVVTNSGDPALGSIPATTEGFFVIEPDNNNVERIALSCVSMDKPSSITPEISVFFQKL